MEQTGVRIFLVSLFAGVLYVFGSLAVMVTTVHSYCEMRPLILLFAVLGFLLAGLTVRSAVKQGGGSKAIFVLPITFFLLGTAIPIWRFVFAIKVCATQAGR